MDTNRHISEDASASLSGAKPIPHFGARLLPLLFMVLCLVSQAAGSIVDGKGIFRVGVAVSDSVTGKPLAGVKLTLGEAGADEIVADADLKQWLPMFAPRITGEFGDAFVYYFGGFSEETAVDGRAKQRQGIRGKLLVEKAGYVSAEVDLMEVIGPSFDSSISIPFVEVHLKPRIQ